MRQIWNKRFGFLGVQIGFMLAQSTMPRIFQTMGGASLLSAVVTTEQE